MLKKMAKNATIALVMPSYADMTKWYIESLQYIHVKSGYNERILSYVMKETKLFHLRRS